MGRRLQLNDEVALEYYRLQKIADNESLVLEPGEEYGLQEDAKPGMTRDKEEKAHLSEIIHVLNDRFSTDFTDGDKLVFDQIEPELASDETLIYQAQNNPVETFTGSMNNSLKSPSTGWSRTRAFLPRLWARKNLATW